MGTNRQIVVSGNTVEENAKMFIAETQLFVVKRTFAEYIELLSDSLATQIKEPMTEGHYYKNDYITFRGREAEQSQLMHFCFDTKEKIRWIAITGESGTGKSRLAFEFIKQNSEKDWKFCYLDWKEYRKEACYNSLDVNIVCNVCLVIDYFSSYTNEIGTWIGKLCNHLKTDYKVRIILIDRQNSTDQQRALWEKELLEADIHVKECKYDAIALEVLSDSDCYEIAKEVWHKKGYPSLSRAMFDREIIAPLKRLSSNNKVNLNILLMKTEIGDGENFNPSTLEDFTYIYEWWLGQEQKRIKSLCKDDNLFITYVQRILFWSNIFGDTKISEIKEHDNMFGVDIGYIQTWLLNNDFTLSTFFEKVICQKCEKVIYGINPDIFGEHMMLKYYESFSTEVNFESLFHERIEQEGLLQYLYFIVRCIQDYGDIFLERYEKLFLLPWNYSEKYAKDYLVFAQNIIYFNDARNKKVNDFYYNEIKKISLKSLELKNAYACTLINLLEKETDNEMLKSIRNSFPKTLLINRGTLEYRYVQGLVNVSYKLHNSKESYMVCEEIFDYTRKNGGKIEFISELAKCNYNLITKYGINEKSCDLLERTILNSKYILSADLAYPIFKDLIVCVYQSMNFPYDKVNFLLDILTVFMENRKMGETFNDILCALGAFCNQYLKGIPDLNYQLIHEVNLFERLSEVINDSNIELISGIYALLIDSAITSCIFSPESAEVALKVLEKVITFVKENSIGTPEGRDAMCELFLQVYSFQLSSRNINRDDVHRKFFLSLVVEIENTKKYYADIKIHDLVVIGS